MARLEDPTRESAENTVFAGADSESHFYSMATVMHPTVRVFTREAGHKLCRHFLLFVCLKINTYIQRVEFIHRGKSFENRRFSLSRNLQLPGDTAAFASRLCKPPSK